jgi:hypothetical protein
MNLLGGGDQALRAVGHDEPQTRQSPLHQVVQEVGADIGRLARAGCQADQDRLAVGGDATGGQDRPASLGASEE